MDAEKAKRAIALQDKIDECTRLAGLLVDAHSVKTKDRRHWTDEKGDTKSEEFDVEQSMMLRRLVISTPDGGSARDLALDFTHDEASHIFDAVRAALKARIASYQTEMKGL